MEVEDVLRRIQDRYFDAPEAPGRRALDGVLQSIVDRRRSELFDRGASGLDLMRMIDVMRRFLRVRTTLARCFPVGEYETLAPAVVVERMLDNEDASNVTWRAKFRAFVDFLTDGCTAVERTGYLDATEEARTSGIRVDATK